MDRGAGEKVEAHSMSEKKVFRMPFVYINKVFRLHDLETLENICLESYFILLAYNFLSLKKQRLVLSVATLSR